MRAFPGRTIVRTVIAVLLAVVLVGCSSTPHLPLRPVTPVPTTTPRPIALPVDDLPHDVLTEWWYYTGHLAAAGGSQYGFEVVVFQVKREAIPIFYAAHVAVTDHQRRQFHYDQRTWTRELAPTTFDLGDGTWTIGGDGTTEHLRAAAENYALDLQVTPTKPPTFHGTNGVISFGPVGDSYYYSDTRLAAVGTVVDNGVRELVTGEAWKDRQWGNFLVTPGGGWDWLSVQLADGSDLMLFLLRDAQGQRSPAYGTWIDPDGKSRILPANAATVAPKRTWHSPHSDTTYPSGWSIDLPDHDLHLELEPVLADQELDTRQSTGQIYWEGEVGVTGQDNGSPITGKGYVELTGYAGVSATSP